MSKDNNDSLKREVYNHISMMNSPITVSEVAYAMGTTTQKASALLTQLCAEGAISWIPYHSKKGYGLSETLTKAKNTHNVVCNGNNNKINIEVVVENEDNVVEFEFKHIKESHKDKFLSLLYNIVYDYFY